MSQELLASKTIVSEGEPLMRGIKPALTSVAGAIGICERGPIGEPVLVTSFEEYQKNFGRFTADSDLALAVKGFFENGGTQLWTNRTVHYTDVSDPATATAQRRPAAGLDLSTCFFDDIGAATAQEVSNFINGYITGARAPVDPLGILHIASDVTGSASKVEVVGGAANAALGFPTTPVEGTGPCRNIKAVTVEEAVEVANSFAVNADAFATPDGRVGCRTHATGTEATLQVMPSTTMDFGFDNDVYIGSDNGTETVPVAEGKDPGA